MTARGSVKWSAILALIGAQCIVSLGCEQDPGDDDDDDAFDLQVTLSEHVGTVAEVTWSVDAADPAEARVEFGREGEDPRSIPVDLGAGAPYTTTVLGMKASEDYLLRAVVETADGTLTSGDVAVTTGAVPVDVPALSVELLDESADMAGDGYLVTSIFTGSPGPVIVDGDGDYVWWHMEEDVGFPVSRARLSRDARHVYYWSPNVALAPGGGAQGPQRLVRVSIDGADVQEWELLDGHHDFIEVDDGVMALIEYDLREVDGEEVEGDRIVLWTPDGGTEEVYSIWQDFEYAGEIDPEPGPPESWAHMNALRHVPEQDVFYVSLRAFDGIFKIDATAGELQWVLGSGYTDFTSSGEPFEPFAAQHGFQVLDGSLLVFNNGNPGASSSRVYEIALDEESMEADITWTYDPEPATFCPTLGDVHRFPSGNTLAVFSTAGQIDEVTPDGELVWRLNAELGGALGYAVWTDSLVPGS